LVTIFGWADGFWRVAFVSAAAFAVLVVVDGLLRRRWLLVRDIVLALLTEFGLGALLGQRRYQLHALFMAGVSSLALKFMLFRGAELLSSWPMGAGTVRPS
jgi:hypothetical protein